MSVLEVSHRPEPDPDAFRGAEDAAGATGGEPGQADAAPGVAPVSWVPPSMARRLAAWLLDLGVVLAASLGVALTQAATFHPVGGLSPQHRVLLERIEQGRAIVVTTGDTVRTWSGMGLWITAVSFALLAVIVLALLPANLGGRTPGMALTRLRVISADGHPARLEQHVLRTVTGVVDLAPGVVPGLVGFLVVARNGDGRRLGDRWAGTRVIDDRHPREPSPEPGDLTTGAGPLPEPGELTTGAGPLPEPGELTTGAGPLPEPGDVTTAAEPAPPAEATAAAAGPLLEPGELTTAAGPLPEPGDVTTTAEPFPPAEASTAAEPFPEPGDVTTTAEPFPPAEASTAAEPAPPAEATGVESPPEPSGYVTTAAEPLPPAEATAVESPPEPSGYVTTAAEPFPPAEATAAAEPLPEPGDVTTTAEPFLPAEATAAAEPLPEPGDVTTAAEPAPADTAVERQPGEVTVEPGPEPDRVVRAAPSAARAAGITLPASIAREVELPSSIARVVEPAGADRPGGGDLVPPTDRLDRAWPEPRPVDSVPPPVRRSERAAPGGPSAETDPEAAPVPAGPHRGEPTGLAAPTTAVDITRSGGEVADVEWSDEHQAWTIFDPASGRRLRHDATTDQWLLIDD